jgi:dTDP-4-dehydrorhamnose reductase
MKRIAIVGANGQVGTEVCLLLREMAAVEPIPVCRTAAGAAFLRHQGFECRIGSVSERNEAPALLQDCDAVADFTLPTGSAYEVRAQMRKLIGAAVAATPAGRPYIYLSSITAFGFRDFQSPLVHHRISRNAYGASKRYAEGLVRKACARRREAYILRVGVVHGELQAVTREMVQRARTNAQRVACVPDCESYTVFAFSIAEALAAIADDHVRPDTYTLVSNPGWRWLDLHRFLAVRAGIADPRHALIGPDAAGSGPAEAAKALAAPLKSLLWKQKDLIQGYLSASMPNLEQRLRAAYHVRNAAAQVRAGEIAGQYRPYGNNHTVLPGRRIDALSDSRTSMRESAQRLRRALGVKPAARPEPAPSREPVTR